MHLGCAPLWEGLLLDAFPVNMGARGSYDGNRRSDSVIVVDGMGCTVGNYNCAGMDLAIDNCRDDDGMALRNKEV